MSYFVIQVSNPILAKPDQAPYRIWQEAYSDIFATDSENIILYWDGLPVPVVWGGPEIEEVFPLLEALMDSPVQGRNGAKFMFSHFMANWICSWQEDLLLIQHDWWAVPGGLTKNLKKTPPLTLSKTGFLCEWKGVLLKIIETFESLDVVFENPDELKKLKWMSEQIPLCGLMYSSTKERSQIYQWHQEAAQEMNKNRQDIGKYFSSQIDEDIEKNINKSISAESSDLKQAQKNIEQFNWPDSTFEEEIHLDWAKVSSTGNIEIHGRLVERLRKLNMIQLKPDFGGDIHFKDWQVTFYPLHPERFTITVPFGYKYDQEKLLAIPAEESYAYQPTVRVIFHQEMRPLVISNSLKLEDSDASVWVGWAPGNSPD